MVLVVVVGEVIGAPRSEAGTGKDDGVVVPAVPTGWVRDRVRD